eukprot:6665327-Alexandrium_andersonii.AAC.1
MRCYRAGTVRERISRRLRPFTLLPCAQPSCGGLRLSTPERAGVYRRLCDGSWTAGKESTTSRRSPGRESVTS